MAQPTRILHVLNYYAPHTSGLTEYARIIAEAFAALGGEVTVLATRRHGSLPSEEVRGGVRVIRAEPLLKLHKGAISVDFIRAYRRLVREADIVHLHLPMLESGVLAWLTPRSTPLVVSYQCDLAPAPRWSAVDRLAVAAVRASARVCCARAHRILVTSKEYATGSPVIGGFQGKWVEVFPPDQAPVGLAPRRAAAGPKVVGFLGRFVEEKGIDVILDAIPLVLEKYPDTRFILAGDYEDVPGGSKITQLRAKLQRFAPNVKTPGKLPDAQLFDFYGSLDVFLLPSVNAYEAFGIVQLEAMKAGVAVIASDMRGVRVPVTLTGCGSLVPAGDSQALARAILEWLSGERQLPPEEIARRAWATFSNEAVVKAIRQVYAELWGKSERQKNHHAAKRA
jgi:glycosyltransferase involved in cell wall biosynthesis